MARQRATTDPSRVTIYEVAAEAGYQSGNPLSAFVALLGEALEAIVERDQPEVEVGDQALRRAFLLGNARAEAVESVSGAVEPSRESFARFNSGAAKPGLRLVEQNGTEHSVLIDATTNPASIGCNRITMIDSRTPYPDPTAGGTADEWLDHYKQVDSHLQGTAMH